jgi:hypothetical protein
MPAIAKALNQMDLIEIGSERLGSLPMEQLHLTPNSTPSL